jgi:hypothetical protein
MLSLFSERFSLFYSEDYKNDGREEVNYWIMKHLVMNFLSTLNPLENLKVGR